MPKATIKLINGTIVTIDGSLEEVNYLINLYKLKDIANTNDKKIVKKAKKKKSPIQTQTSKNKFDVLKIINTLRDCNEADNIEKNVLDKPSELNRVLLPLYILEKHLHDEIGLTTSEISKVAIKLGVKVSRQNSLRAIKFTGPKYVFTDAEGARIPRYRLNRRGVQYMEGVINGTNISD
ncbi:MAG: hypothetical protein HY865_17605 [Chloroflexi bacterium]|nr:hypothetical protein [Chloroflexota bacterium]